MAAFSKAQDNIHRQEFGIEPESRKPHIEDSSVTHFNLPGMRYVFDFPVVEDEIETYLLSAKLSQRLGLTGNTIVAAAKLPNPKSGLPVLYLADGKYEIDRIIYDSLTEIYVIERGKGDFVFFGEEIGVLGILIGYCGPQKGIHDRLIFREIPPVRDR